MSAPPWQRNWRKIACKGGALFPTERAVLKRRIWAAGIFPGGPSKRKEERSSQLVSPIARNSAGSIGSSDLVTLKCTWLPRVVSTMAVDPA